MKRSFGLGRDEKLYHSSCIGGIVLTPQAAKSKSLLNTVGRLRTIWEALEGFLFPAEQVGVEPETHFSWPWL